MKKMRLYNIVIIIGLFLLIPSLYGSEKNHNPNNLLWRISGNGLEAPSYLFGTIHVICADDFVAFEALEEKMGQTEKLMLELNLQDPNLVMGMQMGMVMDDNKTIADLLSEEDFAVVEAFFTDSLNMPLSAVKRVQPFFLVTMMYPHMLGCQPQSYEGYLMELAAKKEIPLDGLETLQDQLDVFKKLTYEEQAEILMESLTDYEKSREEFRQLLDLYLNMDLAGMEQLTHESLGKWEEFERSILLERNQRWIPRMEKLMKEKPVFFAVGAAHLPGENGVLQLLKDKGYTLEPLLE